MLRWLDALPYSILIVFAILMLLLPFRPIPHVLEKLIMLKNGQLIKPIDILDLFYHLIPTILLVIKLLRQARR
jgi:hypothetical protein